MTQEKTAEQPEMVAIRTKWERMAEHPVLAANKILSQFEDDLFLVTFGLLDKPVILMEDMQTVEELKEKGYVGIHPVARLSLTEKMVEDVIQVLSTNLERYREAKAAQEETDD